MRSAKPLLLCLATLLFFGVAIDGQTPVPSRPGIVAPSLPVAAGSRLLSGWNWGEYREFTVPTIRPVDARPCWLACDRSPICRAWTLALAGRLPYAPTADTCYLQATAPAVHSERYFYNGLRNTPVPALPLRLTGDGESMIANSSYASSSSFRTVFLPSAATPSSCREACNEHRATAAPGSIACEYWSFAPMGHSADGSDRLARCFYSQAGARLQRVDGMTAGGPVPGR